MPDNVFFHLSSDPSHNAHIKKEREIARQLRKTSWWKSKILNGQCHYCGGTFPPSSLTMDHIVPLARGGKSKKGNVVPSCQNCNKQKNLETPAEKFLDKLTRSSNPDCN